VKLKLVAASLLVAITGWVFLPPVKTVASYAQGSSQTLSQTSDSHGAEGVNQAPQVSGGESKKEITKTNVRQQNNSTLDGTLGTKTNPSVFSGRNYSKAEIQQLIKDYSAQYGILPDLPLRVAACESGYNQFSKNKSSTASGVYQWLSSSWSNQPAGKMGISVFDGDANIQAAVWLIAHGQISPWNASRSCWSK
jgi:muramidase (phage lysozyme)